LLYISRLQARYAFKEKTDTAKVRVKDIPLSADDGQIIKALEDHNCDIVKFFRECLRIDNYRPSSADKGISFTRTFAVSVFSLKAYLGFLV
jgi:hypothetical protein